MFFVYPYLSLVCAWHRGLERVQRIEEAGSQQVFGAIRA